MFWIGQHALSCKNSSDLGWEELWFLECFFWGQAVELKSSAAKSCVSLHVKHVQIFCSKGKTGITWQFWSVAYARRGRVILQCSSVLSLLGRRCFFQLFWRISACVRTWVIFWPGCGSGQAAVVGAAWQSVLPCPGSCGVSPPPMLNCPSVPSPWSQMSLCTYILSLLLAFTGFDCSKAFSEDFAANGVIAAGLTAWKEAQGEKCFL